MNYRLIINSLLITLSINTSTSYAHTQIQPTIHEGRYYYSQEDIKASENEMSGGFKFVFKRVLNLFTLPLKAIRYIVSKFYPTQEQEKPIQLLVDIPKPIQTKPETASIKPKMIWIGHASFLIQIGGFNIITDPIFGNVKAGPITITKRLYKPGIKIEDLPKIDAVLISHDHVDHTDTYSLTKIRKKNPQVKAFVPKGNKAFFKSLGYKAKNIYDKIWWENDTLSNEHSSLKLTCLPAKHWSIRVSPSSYRKTLFASWMISCKGKNIFFAGDTAYAEHFKQIARTFPLIDLALMPIGPTEEYETHDHHHVDAREALQAFIDLKAKTFVPMHYSCFFVSPRTHEIPINILHTCWQSRKTELQNKKMYFAQIGAQYTI